MEVTNRRFLNGTPGFRASVKIGLNEEGRCGSFRRVRQWVITNPVRGFIVQKVIREFDVYDAKSEMKINERWLDDYVRDPASSVHGNIREYWEAWQVDESGKVSHGREDTFGLCSIIQWNGIEQFDPQIHIKYSTFGRYMTAGVALYLQGEIPGNIFKPNAIVCAGGLPSTGTKPNLYGFNVLAAAVNYAVYVSWDSRPSGPNGAWLADKDGWSTVTARHV